MTVRDAQEIVHLARAKVGYAPRTDLTLRAQLFKARDNSGELVAGHRPVQEEDLLRSSQPGKAPIAGVRYSIASHFIRFHFGDHKHVIPPIGNHTTD